MDASGSYWPFFFLLSLVTVPEVFAKFFILVSVVANVCCNVSNKELSVSKASNKKAVDNFLFLVFLYFLFLSFVFVYVVLFA